MLCTEILKLSDIIDDINETLQVINIIDHGFINENDKKKDKMYYKEIKYLHLNKI
jgi:hypothetical protein